MRTTKSWVSSTWISSGLCLCLIIQAQSMCADGPADNLAEKVRPVPRLGITLSANDRKELETGLNKLGLLVEGMKPQQPLDPNNRGAMTAWDLYADVAIFQRAVKVALDDQEFFELREIDAARKLLATGLQRAEQLGRGESPWTKQAGLVVRGYVSTIDHTPQPYGLIVPESYEFQPALPRQALRHRLDLWFHGRGETLSELNFITQRMASLGNITPPGSFVLHPYGRYCNANKFAGEQDTFEALAAASRGYRIDPNRISARGFSMGGAACWQFAVHHPQRWFAANPGAGFSETPEFLKFFQKETLNPPWWEEKLWRWYDCPGYVGNLRNLPVVAYSGENDIQKQAADLMEAAYQTAGMKLLHLIGPQTGHSIHPESAKEIELKMYEWAATAEKPRALPDQLEFVTYSLIYPTAGWVTVLGMKEHWEPARVVATRQPNREIHVKTDNITALELNMGDAIKVIDPTRLVLDGQAISQAKIDEEPFVFTLENKTWVHQKKDQPAKLAKNPTVCGPIDHAFMSSFIMVKPSKPCAHPAVQKWVDAEMDRAITQWRRQFRGDARVKMDTEITADDIQSANLILWGDPQSNAYLAKISDQLPMGWNASQITAGDQKYDAAQHALIAVYPNPQNRQKYVVLNSGFTYREYDYLNNARQTAKLPDWAIVDLRTPPNSRWPGKIVAADFFNEAWQLKPLRK